MNKKALILFSFLLWILIYIFFSFFNPEKKEDSNNLIQYYKWFDNTHNWVKINLLLNENNYQKIWINPEKYNTFWDFLKDFQSFSWVKIDVINETFVIWLEKENWNILYIPFDYQKNKDLFKNEINKNLAILDIYKAYKNNKLYWWFNSKADTKIIFDYEMKHPKSDELSKIFNKEVNVFDYIKTLEEANKIWIENKELLWYLYDFIWKYENWNNIRKEVCKEINCNIKNVIFSWYVRDENNNPLPWVKIQILNNPNFYTYTKDDWKYEIVYKTIPFSHIRLKSTLNWYSDWYNTHSLNEYFSNSEEINVVMNFNINKYNQLITINNNNKKENEKWKYYIINTEWSKYFIPKDWLFFENWEKYEYQNHDFDIFIYQFTKWSNMDNLLENDTFEPVYWYVWNIMKTFWMPYIQIIDRKTKKEVYTFSSNPMILQNQVYHMKELYENYDKLYWPISKEDMIFLVKYSEEKWWYPIDFDFLTTNNFLRWPARWCLDRKAWTWNNVWHRVLNINWLVELPFYHIKDN